MIFHICDEKADADMCARILAKNGYKVKIFKKKNASTKQFEYHVQAVSGQSYFFKSNKRIDREPTDKDIEGLDMI